jgi:arsenate reductase
MAEGLWNHLGRGEWHAVSAGSNPAGYVHPLAIVALGEIGITLPEPRSKHVDEFADQAIDLVITVCDNAKDSCPVFANAAETQHWPFEDPAHAAGTDAEKLVFFRTVRDQIQARIASYLSSLT